ncbi:hypothetical protein EMPG_12882 [Blastomyces silverae]|uniref:Uncharacterized protein n=1 Tax=Blastomyces silverae TaxID=2060906 RepID=A0A0H1BLQ4_9EURO|nr:hypothetical protein EMPG_12882 [Blastomyces silverae]
MLARRSGLSPPPQTLKHTCNIPTQTTKPLRSSPRNRITNNHKARPARYTSR